MTREHDRPIADPEEKEREQFAILARGQLPKLGGIQLTKFPAIPKIFAFIDIFNQEISFHQTIGKKESLRGRKGFRVAVGYTKDDTLSIRLLLCGKDLEVYCPRPNFRGRDIASLFEGDVKEGLVFQFKELPGNIDRAAKISKESQYQHVRFSAEDFDNPQTEMKV